MATLTTTISRAAHASRAAAANAGRLFLPSDGYSTGRDNGSSWDNYGPSFPFTTPVDPGTWVNQGSSTIASSKDALVLTGAATGSGANIVLRVESYTAPKTLTIYCRSVMGMKAASGGFNGFGLAFRDSAGGGLHLYGLFASAGGVTNIRSTKYTSATAFSADYTGVLVYNQDLNWIRITDDNVNRICSISPDGQNWLQTHSIGRTDFLTANQFGIFVSTENTTTPNWAPIMNVLSYSKT